ncbi:galactose ABC transporter substrate-binding protein [Clostridium sp. SHJSY1]|uniref:galactose ABC transporter substrate-binding protein n=1 Tax=Clostridium sp. SHJSY1 TaxID=2942483 RepID=UPI0028771AE7|nr:galactose ABC transporter substrate-binding protein [Clostridium sp. SHJSY1]MDS0525709.1 galactose ABC transporter substrate-binding protein [Clostridium sp. SHJSY1]
MKILKRMIAITISIFLITTILSSYNKESVMASMKKRGPVEVSVFLTNNIDDFLLGIRKSLEEIEEENKDKVHYTFYDTAKNQAMQNENINKAINSGAELILLNIINRGEAQSVIDRIKEANIPVILFANEPVTLEPIKSYSKAVYLGGDSKAAGESQGKIITDVWNKSKLFVDKNKDGKMEYLILHGKSDNQAAIGRTKYSIESIENSGIEMQQVGFEICNWDEELAYNSTKKLFNKYGELIEVIIANDDTMAIGAVKALQESGYNKGDKLKTIPIVGVDLTLEAKEYIEKGYMLGSVIKSPRDQAEALYVIGMNLLENKNSVEGTKYKLDESGVAVRIPETEIYYNNIFAN